MQTTNRLSKFLGLLLLFAFVPLWMLAQTTIKGTVSDTDGPLMGASVKVKGSQVATITDIDGKYSIAAKQGQSLEFSYVGYTTKVVKVGAGNVLDVKLDADASLLSDVVVVGYGQMKRSDLTGAVTSVDDKAIAKSVPTSIDQVLQGRAAGVQIQANTGTPGGSSTIKIRGTNSLNATSQPIFVIDGVIIDAADGDDKGTTNPLADINPADIVSMDILKDASATAIYGSRASNGVIMITTRRGKTGEALITYDGYVGWQQMPKTLDVMNLTEYAQHYNDISNSDNFMVGPIRSASDTYVRGDLMGEGTNWQKELFRTAMMHSHNLSVTGGKEGVSYAISAGYFNQDGIAISTDYRRQTLRGNLDAQLKKWLKGGISFSMADSKQSTLNQWDDNTSLIINALTSQPSIPVRNADGEYGGPTENYQPSNPVAMATIMTNYNKKQNFRVNTYLEAQILKSLTFKTELSADYNFKKNYYYMPDYYFSEWNSNDTRTSTWTGTNTKYWSWRNILTYNETFAEKHNLNVMLGQEMSHNRYEVQTSTTTGFLSNSATDISAGSYADSRTTGYKNNTSIFSYFGRAFYNYDERYLATFTLRRDGSSKFADGNRWGWFPSAALAWKISNEAFLKDNPVMNNAKLRLGWGQTGNQNVQEWAYMSLLSTYSTNWGNGVLNGNFANKDLKWETTTSYNIGLDLNFFHNRIEFIADWYYKKTKDLLMQVDLPAFLGSSGYGTQTKPWANVGSLRNTGVEFTLNTVNLDLKNGFEWRSNAVLSINRNKVIALDSETGTLPQTFQIGSTTNTVTNTVVGQPMGQFWGFKVIGRFDEPSDFYYKDADGNVQQVAIPEGSSISEGGTWLGDWRYADLNGDGVINNDDQTFIGNPEPKFTWGFGNTFSYKGIDLTIQLSGSYGNDVLNLTRTKTEITGTTGNAMASVLNYAQVQKIDPDGPADFRNYHVTNPDTDMPRLYTESQSNKNNRISDLYVEDGSYIRLQNISLSYTLPKKWLKNIFLENVKVYCNIQNLYTWSKYDGYDPEVGSLYGNALLNGVDYGRYPSPRIYTFGLNVQF